MGSSRLPGKVLMPLAGRPVLHHMIERARTAHCLHALIVATTDKPEDDAVAELARACNTDVFRGSEEDVLDRYVGACARMRADIGVRITSDNPLTDISGIESVVERHLAAGADYTHNLGRTGLVVYPENSALGTGVEAFSVPAINAIHQLTLMPVHRESVTCLLEENTELYRCEVVPAREALRRPDLRLTLDTPEDLTLFRFVYDRLYEPGKPIDTAEAIALLDAHPEIAAVNRMHGFPLLDELYKIQPDGTLRCMPREREVVPL